MARPRLMMYRCLSCAHTWTQLAGGSEGRDADGCFIQPHPPPYGCPACGHMYMRGAEIHENGELAQT